MTQQGSSLSVVQSSAIFVLLLLQAEEQCISYIEKAVFITAELLRVKLNRLTKFNLISEDIMKNYKNSSYAANKYSKDIVYNSEVSGSTSITLEGFLKSDPTLTEADFEFWKNWSDQNYLEESRGDNKQSWKAVSLFNLEYILDSTQLSLEEMVEDKTMEGLVLQTLKQTVAVLLSDSVLTETMKVRFEMFYIQGMRVIEIAEAQGVDEKAVRKSLERIKVKLIKVFYELWDRNNS